MKFLRDVLNLVLVNHYLSILGLILIILAGLNLSFHAKTVVKKTTLSKSTALADHVISTGHNVKCNHFDILATRRSDLQCKIKETLLISELKPSLNENFGSEKLFVY